jgi:cobaltochelatase CobT
MRNLMILAKWLAAQADVEVVTWNGSTACIGVDSTGKKVIRLPKTWCAVKDQESIDLLEGIIDHEALGHGRFTSFGDDKIAKERGYDMNGFTNSVCNILEDVMIETKAIATYPGVQSNLSRTVKILLEKHDFFGSKAQFEQAEPGSLLIGGLLNCLRSACIPGQEAVLGENAEILHELLVQKFGDVWIEVFGIAMKVKNSNSTIENWEITQEIFDVLKQASENQKKNQSNQNDKSDKSDNSDNSDDEDSEGQGKADGDSKSDDSDNDDSEGQDEADGDCKGDGSDGNDSEGQGKAEDDSKVNPNSKPGSSPKSKSIDDLSDAIIAAIEAILDNLDEEISTDISNGASKAISVDAGNYSSSPIREINGMPSMCLRVEQKRIASQVNAVADDLKEALIAQAYSGKLNKLVGKRLNSRVISRVKTGNPRVFQSKTHCDGVASAVSILVDTSGSMIVGMSDKMPRFIGSVGVSVGLSDVLSEFDVPFELNFYDDDFFKKKGFNEEWNDTRKEDLFPIPRGSTTTGAAMQMALSELIMRDEAKKLLIVITDGDTSDIDVLASCYEEAKIAGIEIASLMVGHQIPAIKSLADKVGFSVETHDSCQGIAKYVVKHVLATI